MHSHKPVAKRVYLVRHGQTVANVANTVQDLTDELTEHGKGQAAFLGTRFKSVQFDVLYASDAMRAMQTAGAIAEMTGHTVTPTPLLRECNYPSSMTGLSVTDPRVTQYIQAWDAHTDTPEWKYEDEESFAELMTRVDDALALFLKDPNPTIVAVSHGHFIKTIVTKLLFGEGYTPKEWDGAMTFLSSTNTGVNVLEYVDYQGTFRWRLLTWNDHAHLAE